jgi:glutaredoxin
MNPNIVVRNIAIVTFALIGVLIGGRAVFHNASVALTEQNRIAQERFKEIPITVYVTPSCPWCRKTKAWFLSKQLPITVFDIEHNQSAAREMRRLNPEGGVPTIIIENEVIDGFDVSRIEQVLAELSARRTNDPP